MHIQHDCFQTVLACVRAMDNARSALLFSFLFIYLLFVSGPNAYEDRQEMVYRSSESPPYLARMEPSAVPAMSAMEPLLSSVDSEGKTRLAFAQQPSSDEKEQTERTEKPLLDFSSEVPLYDHWNRKDGLQSVSDSVVSLLHGQPCTPKDTLTIQRVFDEFPSGTWLDSDAERVLIDCTAFFQVFDVCFQLQRDPCRSKCFQSSKMMMMMIVITVYLCTWFDISFFCLIWI